MAFHAPVNVQNVVSATSELWPTMSAALQAPWRGLARQSQPAAPTRPTPKSVTTASTELPTISETQSRSAFRLPDSLEAVPMSALRQTPSQNAMKTIPTVAGTLASVPTSNLRLCNPMARSMPLKAMMARQYSTMSRIGPLSNLRPIPRVGNVGLALAQQRSIFGGNSSRNLLAHMEQTANNNPQSPTSQNAFYQALLRANMSEIVVDRYQTGRFASNQACENAYIKALERVGQSEKAVAIQQAKDSNGGNITPSQLQAVGQAVGAHVGAGQMGKTRGGTGIKKDPLYVVIEESMWSTIFKWLRWLLTFGLSAYVALMLITLFIETSGVLKKVGGGGSAEVRPEHQNTRFSDVHGCDEAKEELQDVVDFLKNPERYNKLGGRLPKGVLLVGPPGTGKTLLARAVAGEAGVPFFYMSGSEFDEVYVGVGAKRVRELFTAARNKAPAIVFIDELDAVGGKRNSRDANYHRQTLNQLLNDLDGFDQSTGVIFIAATNHPEILDKALTRPGRFDRHIAVDLPDVRGRLAILQYHMKKIKISTEVDLSKVARGTPGFSGAELENLANTAAIRASKNQSKAVTVDDIEWAKDKIMMGSEKKNRVTMLADKLHTAYHEAGHTLVAIYTKGPMDLHKATILPRGHANGITHFLPRDRSHQTREEYIDYLKMCMGGKMAEEIIYGPRNVSSGPSGDIQSATNEAYAMVTMYGFSDILGNVDYHNNYKNISPETKRIIDTEVKRLIDEARDSAKGVLTEHRNELDMLAKALVQYETLDKDEIMKVIKGEKLKDRLMSMPDAKIKIPDYPNPPQIVPPVGGGDEPGPPPVGGGGVPA